MFNHNSFENTQFSDSQSQGKKLRNHTPWKCNRVDQNAVCVMYSNEHIAQTAYRAPSH